MTIFTRKLALADKRLFYAVGSVMYIAIALVGLTISLIINQAFPALPNSETLLYIIIEGFAIAIYWLLQYKIIAMVGAANTVIIIAMNYLAASIAGLLFLGETASPIFILGASIMLVSVLIAFKIKPDKKHAITKKNVLIKLLIVVSMTLAYATGALFEKKAIDTIGVPDYLGYGWAMQAIAATFFALTIGRHELKKLKAKTIKNSFILGLITSIAGGLYILALSMGTLSGTVMVIAGKVAITLVLAAWLLHERNEIRLRVLALILSIVGMALIVI